MRAVLFGRSAVAHWLTADRPPDARRMDGGCLERCNPSVRTVAHISMELPHIPEPYHCLVPGRYRRLSDKVVLHISQRRYAKGDFSHIAPGVFAACPELALAQLAPAVTLCELIAVASALCGTFCFRADAEGGLGHRSPLTSKRRIAAFVSKHAGLKGVKALRRALPHIVERAASPPEIFLLMVLGLPRLHGGYGLLGGRANRRMRLGRGARAIAGRETIVPDVHWLDEGVVLEYDSNAEHLTPAQVTRDSKKRLAYASRGLKVLTVTARQLYDAASMRHVAKELSRDLGRSLRIRGDSFGAKHAALYETAFCLNAYRRVAGPERLAES